MSFILEALKKVERQHAQNRAPLAVNGTISIAPHGKRWPILMITGVVAVMMFGLGVILERQEAAKESMETTELSEDRLIVSGLEVIENYSEPNLNVSVVPEGMSDASDKTEESVISDKTILHFTDLPAGIRSELSSLKVDVHYYQEQPEKRFVMINQHRYVEGDQLVSGPILVEIINNGVILKHRGQRFVLSRL